MNNGMPNIMPGMMQGMPNMMPDMSQTNFPMAMPNMSMPGGGNMIGDIVEQYKSELRNIHKRLDNLERQVRKIEHKISGGVKPMPYASMNVNSQTTDFEAYSPGNYMI